MKDNFVFFRCVVLTGIAIAVSGCATVRNAREAQKESSRGAGERVVRFDETGLPSGEAIGMLDLEKVALMCSPTVLQARQAVIMAQLAVRDIDASYIPVIDASAGYTMSTSNDGIKDSSSSMDGSGSLGLRLNMLVYDFGKTKASSRQAVANLAAAEKDARTAELDTIHRVRKACFALKRALELNAVAEDSEAQYAEHLRQMRDRFDVGVVNSYAVTKSELDWSNSILELVSTSNKVKTARAALNLAMGFAESPEYEVGECPTGTYDGIGIDGLMEIARTNSPALASARAAAEGAKYQVDRMIAELYPTLSAGIDFNAVGDSTPLVWNAAVSGNALQKIFTAGRRRRAVERAVSQMRIARSREAEVELEIYNNLTVAVLNAAKAKRGLTVANDTERLAEENYRIVSENYNVGKASDLERTDAQVALYSARAAAVSAHYDWYDSQIAISLIIGE